MDGLDGRKKTIVDRKFLIYAIVFILVVAGFVTVPRIFKKPVKQYANCYELKLDGHVRIPKGDPLYQERLDANHNGIACE